MKATDQAVRLSIVGSFAMEYRREQVSLPGTIQRLLAFLAVARRPLRRAHVAGSLWPETSEQHAGGNLRTALWRLQATCPDVIATRADTLAIDPAVDVDLYRAAALAQAVLRGEMPSRPFPVTTLSAGAELLPGWYDDWVVVERESFRELRLRALEHLCREFAGEERFADAIEAGLAAVAGDPLRESSHRALIRAYLLEGNPAQALRQYRQCREVLAHELGVAPSNRMATLLSEHGLAGVAGAVTAGTGAVMAVGS